ncbi:MAG: PHP domain-containing protein [Clostridia bacterium]|nr:PHP domain-containing protein [Clostridia bacterium]
MIVSQIDLHMHTTASDGTNTPRELLEKINASGIKIFACTDHDTVDGAAELSGMTLGDVRLIPGVEFSCRSSAGKCHILGYGIDLDNEKLIGALEDGKKLREDKLEKRLAFLRSRFGIVPEEAEINWLKSQNSPGKPHLGQMLVKRGLAASISEAIKKYLEPLKDGDDRLPSGVAIAAVAAAGGIPVWAHPLVGEGEKRLPREEFQMQLQVLLDEGIKGLECWYSRYTREETAFLTALAKEKGLLASSGSDYHGHNKQEIFPGQLSAEEVLCLEEEITVLNVFL